jgi:hypothetical protein
MLPPLHPKVLQGINFRRLTAPPLTEAQLARILQNLRAASAELWSRKLPPPLPPEEPALAAVRVRHHNFARLAALGYSATEVAAMLGAEPDFLAVLFRDPSFRELVAHYSEKFARDPFEDDDSTWI